LIVLDTMNFWMESALPDLQTVLGMVDVLMINDSEARQLSSQYSLVKAAKEILKMGPKYLIIKKGEHGRLLFHDNHVFVAPALPLEEVFDPTGAGDTVRRWLHRSHRTYPRYLFRQYENGHYRRFAMASFCVEKFGTTRLREITRADIDTRIQDFVELVQFDISLI
jgi:bifunctional ADP-heptose synthase (sugar kinase/adenylyltransferase)